MKTHQSIDCHARCTIMENFFFSLIFSESDDFDINSFFDDPGLLDAVGSSSLPPSGPAVGPATRESVQTADGITSKAGKVVTVKRPP